jgi:hypothetical protein
MIALKKTNKILVFTILISSCLNFSCNKQYVCVCSVLKSGNNTNVDSVKTTKLGSKGYDKTCQSYNSDSLTNCHLK